MILHAFQRYYAQNRFFKFTLFPDFLYISKWEKIAQTYMLNICTEHEDSTMFRRLWGSISFPQYNPLSSVFSFHSLHIAMHLTYPIHIFHYFNRYYLFISFFYISFHKTVISIQILTQPFRFNYYPAISTLSVTLSYR